MQSKQQTETWNKPWVRPRHAVITAIARRVMGPAIRHMYGVQAETYTGPDTEPCLILYNHQTPCDQFFVGMSFHRPVYYLATEDIFSKGWISSLLRWAVAPIPFIKQTTDTNALGLMMKVAREGGSIAIAPEGNRTYSGKTEYMSPAITFLARRMRLPIVLYRIEGGYGVQPRWSDGIRKGHMRGYAAEVIRPEEYAKMTGQELFSRIRKGLDVCEASADGTYASDRLAEFLERVVYVCPFCGLSSFRSSGNEIACLKCGRKTRYHEDKHLEGIGFELPFAFVNDWYEYQKKFVNGLDLRRFCEAPMYEDEVSVFQVIVYQKKKMLEKQARLRLYGDRIEMEGGDGKNQVMPYDSIAFVALIGRNRLNLSFGGTVYQFRGDQRFNAMKYMHMYYRYRNMTGENSDGEFLGL